MSKLIEQYSQLTIDITRELSKAEKKNNGIFISPKIIITKLFDSIIKYVSENEINIQTILEPSCGTCEIVNYCDNIFNGARIDAVEFNDKIFERIKGLNFKNNVTIFHQDFIKFNSLIKYDLIVGNPPYFVLEKGYKIPEKMEPYVYGRPNIFGLFIIQAISMLAPNGILAFIIPKSFLNSAYYSKIRNYIKETCKILEIVDFEKDNKFIDTQQSTFGIILQKESNNKFLSIECNYSIKICDNFMFTNDSIFLKNLFEGSTTLAKIGLGVRTGNIVWNEHKDELTEDENETVLLYNTNLTKEHTIDLKTFKNEEKHQYIRRDGRIDPVLVVNRGNGNSAYKLNYALILNIGPYLIENHLNEIYSPKKIKKEELIILFNKIIQSFENPKTQLFITTFLGNNGLSKTELETIFPIYL
jgi:methylase of polypeptide subunit release factors